jgi:hypothetical protein
MAALLVQPFFIGFYAQKSLKCLPKPIIDMIFDLDG